MLFPLFATAPHALRYFFSNSRKIIAKNSRLCYNYYGFFDKRTAGGVNDVRTVKTGRTYNIKIYGKGVLNEKWISFLS